MRKAVVILFPAYILCCMFEVLDPPRPMVENAWDSLMQALGNGPRVFSAAELKAKGVGARPMLRYVGYVRHRHLLFVVLVVSSPVCSPWSPPEGMIFTRHASKHSRVAQFHTSITAWGRRQPPPQSCPPSFASLEAEVQVGGWVVSSLDLHTFLVWLRPVRPPLACQQRLMCYR